MPGAHLPVMWKLRRLTRRLARCGSLAAPLTLRHPPVQPYPQVKRMRGEGIVIKALDSPWCPADRSGHWLK